MIIDIPGQFAKLFPSYSRSIDLTPEQRLEIVEGRLAGCRRRGQTGHWAYEGPAHHLALAELRDALAGEGAQQRVAA